MADGDLMTVLSECSFEELDIGVESNTVGSSDQVNVHRGGFIRYEELVYCSFVSLIDFL